MYSNVLLPTDAREGSERAVAHALGIADRYDGRVHALFVTDPTEEQALSGDERRELRTVTDAAGRSATERIATRAAEVGVDASREHRDGVAHEAILTYVDEAGIELVVMATRSRSGPDRPRLGSTTERVIRRSAAPVLAVPVGSSDRQPDDPEELPSYDDVLVPTDGSDGAERAADSAIAVAERYDATVHAVYVVDEAPMRYEDAPRSLLGPLEAAGRRAVDEVASLAEEAGLGYTTSVRRGVPFREILDRGERIDADLVAMGTRGRTGRPAVLLGSTTARVLRHSSIPVLASR